MYVSLERERERKMEMERNEYESLDQATSMILSRLCYVTLCTMLAISNSSFSAEPTSHHITPPTSTN
ncbi:hypothetical protein HBH56_153030 [Parastagonospora nodorum]|uniref:Uncharacterized protein n=1 Tax=Phaeosphaeria nodorum (strain SN15 / ATCC MYA-4574 / FGSC 10173) TaxID=321614 RepID=A0A7U2EZL3_PHANO|nr:hypothetical protein HBH56_153030 [Parastagonospora nodorum]QRC96039.1 hypothetical protein JI435_408230 [Parastagonospora nodorum SN15]KAH3926822.1 hypothetical protein HBH54_164650 [Parastagonospora nodorum]KAH3996915.1 hypothetical protein HBI10_152700 [Parastagonospora nodorum]KAH4012518.1 hypothetical protein HBI13_187390 [Parastagonospora nodorum]